MVLTFWDNFTFNRSTPRFGSIDIEDLIAEEDMVVTISREVKEAGEEGSGLT